MTRMEILKYYPNATESFIQRNLGDPCPARPIQNPKPESAVRHEPLAAHAGQKGCSTRVKVRIISCRCRLLDADNLAGAKFLIDALRYDGLIRDDSPEAIDLELTQVKVAKRCEEETIVVISRIPEIEPETAAQIYSKPLTN